MKKIFLTLFLLLTVMSAGAGCRFSAGIFESHYVYGTVSPVKNLKFKLEHSLYTEKMGWQRITAGASYGTHFLTPGLRWEAGVQGGTTWNRNYQVVWGYGKLAYDHSIWGIEATVQPHYDSELHYKTCWQAGGHISINRSIAVVACYTTIPEYRMSEKRVRGGFEFKTGKLSVRPELSFSVDGGDSSKNMRVLMSMNYDF